MTPEQPNTRLIDLVEDADRAIWNFSRPGAVLRRNHAVRQALQGGWTTDEIAARLRVRIQDVEHWTTADV